MADAANPKTDTDAMYHIGLKKDEVGSIALLPGDPGRVPRIAKHFDKPRQVASNRGYVTHGGYVDGEYVIAMSGGIGGPANAIAVDELARLGVKTMIRIGTCGAIHGNIGVGSLIIADSAVRLDGTSKQYVMPEFPAAASPEVTVALTDAALRLKKNARVGITASTDSFYVGQGRPGHNGYAPSHSKNIVQDLMDANVLCFEMECSTLFTLGRIYGVRTGSICSVVANRVTGEFDANHKGIDDAIEVAIKSLGDLKKIRQ